MNAVEPPPETVLPPEELDSIAAAARAYVDRIKAGDVGSLPVILGMIVIVVFFTIKSPVFFSSINFNNLIVQMAGTTVVAIGVVFVLLLGEIDLSIGYVSGIAGVMVAWLQQPGTDHQVPGIVAILIAVAVGALIGVFQGSFVAFIGVPSFVVTLAGLLIWQGVILRQLGTEGVIGIQDAYINNVANYVLSENQGWAIAIVFTVGYAAATFGMYLSRRRAGLTTGNVILSAVRVLFYGALVFVAVAVCNHSRGVPLVGLIMLGLVVAAAYVAGRTTYGRHVYAVGGSAEAARRAGINVKFIRVTVFMISGAMAAMGGVIFASRLNSVDLTAGGGTILLDAISAAVIGGVSLFGGRGRVSGALFGGLIIAIVANGIDLVGYPDSIKLITTGVILLAAVTLDTVLRRRQAAVGR
jgi:D-xylose transport system permease protein